MNQNTCTPNLYQLKNEYTRVKNATVFLSGIQHLLSNLEEFVMGINSQLANDVYKLFHGGKLSISELATETGVSESTLYRSSYAFIDTPSALPITLRNLLLVMKAQGNYKVLKTISNYCGFLLARLPTARRNKKSSREKINELQSLQVETIQNLLEFDATHTPATRTKCINSLLKNSEYEVGLIRDLKYDFGQLEIVFD
jgi:AraC-like DNA-binding protein